MSDPGEHYITELHIAQDADHAAVRALVDALPRCEVGGCASVATHCDVYDDPVRCDRHAAVGSPFSWQALPYAPALRALLKRMEEW